MLHFSSLRSQTSSEVNYLLFGSNAHYNQVMRETRSYCKAAKRSLRSLSKEPVRVHHFERKKSNRKHTSKPALKVNEPPRQCNSCLEMVDKLFQLTCNHLFCRDCVRGLFVAALEDQSLLPVKCCGQRVDQRLRRAVLTLVESDRFGTALGELEATNKMYCPKPECSTFHNLDAITQSSTGQFSCLGCKLELCATCRTSHSTMSCAVYKSLPPADRTLNDVLFFHHAKNSSYAQCYNCRRFVEHNGGCYNMYCRCGVSFSYSAGRYTGTAGATNTSVSEPSDKAKSIVADTAYAREEAPCSHIWTQNNHQLDESILCYLCRRHDRLPRLECSQCYIQACGSCAKTAKK